MRIIEFDDLEAWRIDGIQHVRDIHCKAKGMECYTCDGGIITPSCEHFRSRHRGFRCDEISIPRDRLK